MICESVTKNGKRLEKNEATQSVEAASNGPCLNHSRYCMCVWKLSGREVFFFFPTRNQRSGIL